MQNFNFLLVLLVSFFLLRYACAGIVVESSWDDMLIELEKINYMLIAKNYFPLSFSLQVKAVLTPFCKLVMRIVNTAFMVFKTSKQGCRIFIHVVGSNFLNEVLNRMAHNDLKQFQRALNWIVDGILYCLENEQHYLLDHFVCKLEKIPTTYYLKAAKIKAFYSQNSELLLDDLIRKIDMSKHSRIIYHNMTKFIPNKPISLQIFENYNLLLTSKNELTRGSYSHNHFPRLGKKLLKESPWAVEKIRKKPSSILLEVQSEDIFFLQRYMIEYQKMNTFLTEFHNDFYKECFHSIFNACLERKIKCKI